MSTKRVLIVEDDAPIADLLRMHLGDEGYDVAHAASGDAGLRLLEQEGPWDALVLDVMLPGVDGLQVCQRARAMARYVPIIIISARGSETQRIVGLELGADDYLAKPFSMPELVARVRALLRRAEAMAQSARIDAGAIELGGLQLDPVARTASVDGNALELTPREFDLLAALADWPILEGLLTVWLLGAAGFLVRLGGSSVLGGRRIHSVAGGLFLCLGLCP